MDGIDVAIKPVAALFVDISGVYSAAPGVECWGTERDARKYAGPHPVVAHPPCQRWGRFWHGSPRAPHRFSLGDDDECFAAAVGAVRRWGGILEHPADSHAWEAFGMVPPPRIGGWHSSLICGGWTCYVEQAFYGSEARKPTWLYACKTDLPTLRRGTAPQRLDPVVLARHGYEVARRRGIVSLIGGKEKVAKRDATPIPFRDLLLSIARTAE